MSNFIEEFKRGQTESIKGIPFGEGLEQLTLDINGIQKGRIYGIGGPEKSGKTTITDYAFILQPYLYSLEKNINIRWIYYSFEIDRISKEFDFITFFLCHDHKVRRVPLPDGVKRNGQSKIDLSPDYLRGYLLDDEGNNIKIHPDLKPLVQQCYEERIVPLFGEFDMEGNQIKKGLIKFIEQRENPTGIYKDVLAYAGSEGRLIKDNRGEPYLYIPDNADSYRIVVVDHIRRLRLERGWQLKQTIDKASEYMCELRNLLGYTFVPILHTNRSLGDISRLSYLKGDIYPTSDNLKDSGALGEDCNYLITTFNPNDDQYALKEHFGFKVRDSKGNILYPHFKTIHLVASRHGEFPRHYKVNMIGNLKKFEKLK